MCYIVWYRVVRLVTAGCWLLANGCLVDGGCSCLVLARSIQGALLQLRRLHSLVYSVQRIKDGGYGYGYSVAILR